MPSVNIREIDRTGNEAISYIENMALISGVKIEVYDADGQLVSLDGEYTSLASFKNRVTEIFEILDSTVLESGDEQEANEKLREISHLFIKDKGFAMAYLTLSNGLPVQYFGLYDLTYDTNLDSGEESEVEPDFNFDVEPEAKGKDSPYDKMLNDIVEKFEEFTDRGKYDFKFISAPYIDVNSKQGPYITVNKGKENEYTVPVRDSFINSLDKIVTKVAGDRGDAIGLTYAPSYMKKSTEVDKFINTELNQEFYDAIIERPAVTWSATESYEKYGSYGSGITSNFATTFSVAVKIYEGGKVKNISYEFIKDTFPAYLDYLVCYGKFVKSNPSWFAISGSSAGATPLSTLIPLNKYGDSDVAIFQPRDAGENDKNVKHIAMNTITNIRPFGYILWGNRTMHPLNKPITNNALAVQLVASDFLNIRSLCCDLKKTIYRAARKYSFAPNTDTLWFNFKSEITPLLERMRNNQGIRSYQILKVNTTKKAVLAARIIISPIEAVEDFDITVELTDSVELNG